MSEPEPKSLGRYTVLSGILCLALIVVSFIVWNGSHSKQGAGVTERPRTSNQPKTIVPPLSIENAVDRVKKAIATTSVEEVGQSFHLGDEKASGVLEYLKGLELSEDKGIKMSWVLSGSGERPYQGIAVQWMDDRQLRARLAPLFPDESGVWKVDFEVFACRCTPNWEHIQQGEVSEAKVRVVMREDNYFNLPFWDEGWRCFRLTWLEDERPIYGYIRKGSPQELAVNEMLRKSKSATLSKSQDHKPRMRAMLQVKRPEEALKNQFEIVRVLASDWLEEEVPYDQQFEAVPSGR